MYLTAHRVRSMAGAEGIQVFLHVHEPAYPWPQDPWLVPGTHPGRLVAQQTPVRPGGNTVLSFLDIMGPEQVECSELRRILESLAKSLPVEQQVREASENVYIQFGAVAAIEGPDERNSEFRVLCDAALALLVEHVQGTIRSAA